jgi:hypothetical protein
MEIQVTILNLLLSFCVGSLSIYFSIKYLPIEWFVNHVAAPICNACGLKIRKQVLKLNYKERNEQRKRFDEFGDICDRAYDAGLNGKNYW